MLSSDSSDRVVVLLVSILVLLGPVLILVLALGFLVLTGNLVLGRVTPVEFLELYLLELLLFAGIAYGIYRLKLWLVGQQLPEVLDGVEPRDDGKPSDEEGDGQDQDLT